MHARHRLYPTLILFTGLLLAFVPLSSTSVLAQRTAETADDAPEHTQRTAETLAAAPKSAHTPATTIENASGNLIFQISAGGSLLAPDQGGAIPAEGAGARMMWYPSQSAFRAGEVGTDADGSQWDANNIGHYSVAFGDDTEASGTWSMAVGDQTKALDNSAVAMGWKTTASGEESTAMGQGTTASASEATAMGLDTEASGPSATAMGNGTTAATSSSLSIGTYNDTNTSSDNTLLVAGNGSSGSRSDALVLDYDGNLEISGSLTENSDRRLKTNIEPLGEGVLNALREIRPVRFHFKSKSTHPSGPQIGLIAQEVQKEFPELVNEGSNGYLSVSYTKFSTVLLEGLQEQQTTIEKQQDQISELKAENEEIKERLAALEAEESTPAAAGLMGPWGLALLLGLGGLAGGVLWRRHS